MLQVAKNFEQCEKAKAIMQQAKGPTEQVNYSGTKSPSMSERNWGQGNYRGTKTPPKSEQNRSQDLTASTKLAPDSIVQVRHTLALNALLQTSDALGRAVGESDTSPVHSEWGHPFTQSHPGTPS